MLGSGPSANHAPLWLGGSPHSLSDHHRELGSDALSPSCFFSCQDSHAATLFRVSRRRACTHINPRDGMLSVQSNHKTTRLRGYGKA